MNYLSSASTLRWVGLLLGLVLVPVALYAASPSEAALGKKTRFAVELLGANEVSPPADEDGSGIAKLWLAKVKRTSDHKICWNIRFQGIDPTSDNGGHIHFGPAGVNGPIVINFDFVAAELPPVEDCKRIPSSLARLIKEDPAGYYVNIHTADPGYPAGALRGQLG